MPYSIVPFKYGFRVCKKDDKDKCFSNKPLPRKQAIKQMQAIIISENKNNNVIKINQRKYKQKGGQRCW